MWCGRPFHVHLWLGYHTSWRQKGSGGYRAVAGRELMHGRSSVVAATACGGASVAVVVAGG